LLPKWKLTLQTAEYLIPIGEISIKDVAKEPPQRFITYFNGTYKNMPKFNINGSLDGLNFYQSSLIREYLVMVHLEDVYLSSNGGIVSNNKRVHIFKQFTPKVGIWPVLESYENVVFPWAASGSVPGHWLNDALCGLIQVPKEIINKSHIIHQFNHDIVLQQLNILGWDTSKVITAKDSWIYAKNAYIVYSLEHLNSLNIAGLPVISRMFRERLGLTSIKPFKYCMTNRPKGPRCIKNYRALLRAAVKTFPDVTWESFVTNEVNISNTARMYAECKFLVCPCGSNCINTIWMGPGSGICVLMANFVDYPNLAWAMILDIYAVGVSNPTWSHFKTGGKANIPFTMKTIDYLMKAVDAQQWPESDNYIDAFELTRTEIRMRNHPELFEYNNGPTFSIAELI
jgi:hypothetical protein